MERESNSMQALCRGGCGFYGNPSTDGLCSLCYKEALKKKQTPPQTAPSPPSVSAQNMMETAIPTIPVLQIPPVSASPILPTDSKKDVNIHLPINYTIIVFNIIYYISIIFF